MSFKFGDVTRNLSTKGFAQDPSAHHPYLYFYRNGKRTRFYTYTSHGKSGDDVGDDIVHSMKRQLGLGTMKQVRQLVECTMDQAQYLNALIQLGSLPREPEPQPEPPKPEPTTSRKSRKG
jgi:hypothetical protein